MVYRRRYRGRYRGRRRGRRSKYSPWIKAAAPAVGFIAAKAAAMVARKYLNVERKVHNQTVSETATDAGSVRHLTNIAQGDTEHTRDGQSIKLTQINLKGFVNSNTNPVSDTIIRLIIIMDTAQDGTNTPETAGVNGYLDATDSMALRDLDYGTRYKTLMDKTIFFDDNKPIKAFNFYKKLNQKVKYVGGTAADASAGVGSLWLLALSNEDTLYPAYGFSMRIRYLDN